MRCAGVSKISTAVQELHLDDSRSEAAEHDHPEHAEAPTTAGDEEEGDNSEWEVAAVSANAARRQRRKAARRAARASANAGAHAADHNPDGDEGQHETAPGEDGKTTSPLLLYASQCGRLMHVSNVAWCLCIFGL